MASDFLNEIIAHKKNLLKEKKAFWESLKAKLSDVDRTRYGLFKKAISKPGEINLIAEIKKASPSQGIIRDDFDAVRIARIYQEQKAAAISILTEEKFFLGKPGYLKEVSNDCRVPLLMKDFVIDEHQLYEAVFCGASAVLLIVAALTDEDLKNLLKTADGLDLGCLVEVHDEQELNRALEAGAGIIGINNRDLHTFQVDFKVSERLLPKVPEDRVTVVESGLQSRADVQRFKALGANAVLIGETFMRSPDIGERIKELMHG